MTLTTEQLILIKDAVGTVGCVISADDVRFANTTLAFIDAELLRRKVGPFTLAEAVASGKPFKRPGWNDYATALVDSDDEGYMCFVFATNGREPAYADEILADDYELAEGGE